MEGGGVGVGVPGWAASQASRAVVQIDQSREIVTPAGGVPGQSPMNAGPRTTLTFS